MVMVSHTVMTQKRSAVVTGILNSIRMIQNVSEIMYATNVVTLVTKRKIVHIIIVTIEVHANCSVETAQVVAGGII